MGSVWFVRNLTFAAIALLSATAWLASPADAAGPSAPVPTYETYRVPFYQLGAGEAPQPVRTISAPREATIYNPWQGGAQVSQEITFDETEEAGEWVRRRGVESVNYGPGGERPLTPEECFLLNLSQLIPMQIPGHERAISLQLDEQALSEMVATGYITPEMKARYLSGSVHQDDAQFVYYGVSSWMSAAELKETFGGKIPWVRLGEVQGPPGLSAADVVKGIAEGRPGFRVRLRRATLRLSMAQDPLSSFYLRGDNPGLGGLLALTQRFRSAPLPWMDDPDWAAAYRADPSLWNSRVEEVAFEAGRGSHDELAKGDVFGLMRYFAATAVQRIYRIVGPQAYMRIDFDRYPVFMQALDETHAAIYARQYGAKVVAQAKYTAPDGTVKVKSLLKVGLGTLFEKTDAGNLLPQWRELRAKLPESERADPMAPLRLYYLANKQSNTLVFNPRPGDSGAPLSPPHGYTGVLISRQVRPTSFHDLPTRVEGLGYLPTNDATMAQLARDYSIYRQPVQMPDAARPENGLATATAYLQSRREEGIILTNFEPSLAASDPHYVEFIVKCYEFQHSNGRGAEDTKPELIFAKDLEIIRQAERLGFRSAGQASGFTILSAEPGQLIKRDPLFLNRYPRGVDFRQYPLPDVNDAIDLPGFPAGDLARGSH